MTRQEFLSGANFTVANKEGIFKYSEKIYGGELCFLKNGKCSYVIEICEINEAFVQYYFFEEKHKIFFSQCALKKESEVCE